MAYKCRNCGGELAFDPASQKLRCPYCDSVYDLSEYEEQEAPQETAAPESETGFITYQCPHCGAEVVCEPDTIATSCVYCNTPLVMAKTPGFSRTPDAVLPFAYDKKRIGDLYESYVRSRPFAPEAYKTENVIEKIQGIYVPFWLYDLEMDGQMLVEGERTHHHSDSEYDYTDHHVFQVDVFGHGSFHNLPVDASSKTPDDAMDSIEPFDLNALKPFDPGYMAGYAAQRYDQDATFCAARARHRAENSTRDHMLGSVFGYTTTRVLSENFQPSSRQSRYVLLPAYMLFMDYDKDADNVIAINGQTGKIVGNIPIDRKKQLRFFLLVFLPVWIVLFILCLFLFFG